MLVWRIQCSATGDGPYIKGYRQHNLPRRLWADLEHMSYAHSSDWRTGEDRHPSPDDETGLDNTISSDEFCCFTSASALRQWFEGYGRLLDKAGYEVVVFQVDKQDVRQGKFQSVFRKAQATRLMSFSPLTIIGGTP